MHFGYLHVVLLLRLQMLLPLCQILQSTKATALPPLLPDCIRRITSDGATFSRSMLCKIACPDCYTVHQFDSSLGFVICF
jgi:hypothetical protein